MNKLLKVAGITSLVIVTLLALGWIFVVPGELKTLVSFSRWQRGHVRASGYVDRAPTGTRVYWEEFGKQDGPPVVVLHAGLCSIQFMGGQIPALSQSYRVLAIDSRGHGKSTNTAPVLTYEMLTDDVVAVMADRGIARADVVGWSDGGIVALDLARRYPEHVGRVVAFGANHTPPPDGTDVKETEEFRDAKPDAPMLAPVHYLYEQESPAPDQWPVLFEREKAMVFAGPNWSLEQLGAIRAPVLLENGEHDLVLLPYATAMKNAIPGARLEIVRGQGHELPLSSPDKANPIMLGFLQEH